MHVVDAHHHGTAVASILPPLKEIAYPLPVFITLLLAFTMVSADAGPADDLALQLERQTQELLDAVAGGNRDPWTRYLHEDLIYAAEDGSIKSKAQLVEEVQPLPKPIWGKLRVTRFRTVRHGSTAVCSYVAEEDEGYYGQTIHARYLSTDTWIETPEGWRLLASQVLALRDDPPQLSLAERGARSVRRVVRPHVRGDLHDPARRRRARWSTNRPPAGSAARRGGRLLLRPRSAAAPQGLSA